MSDPAYDRLRARFARIATVQEAGAMLGWDAATMMPPGGGAARGEQLATLAGIAHGMLCEAATGDDLAAAEAAPPEGVWDRRNLALMRAAHARATAIPGDLVEASSRACSTCEKVWREARRDSDFARVQPYLAEVVRLARAQGEALGAALGLSPYDALMDQHQNGVRAADVEPVFAGYEAFLRRVLPEALALQESAGPAPVLTGPFAPDAQEALCRFLAERAGLDFAHARLDRSAHPFSGGTPSDVRITTRYDEADLSGSLMGVLHETGHALYERGLPPEWARQPVGEAAGMAVHESQSLIVEMQACRSDPYLSWLAKLLAGRFGDQPGFGALARVWRRVERGLIRVDADEMTYPAHVILRFRLERAMISGELEVADLPGAWADGLSALLGIVPPDDRLGCLQDIHWYDGAFGYFPSYTLGAMAAAQLMEAARAATPGLDEALGLGDLGPLLAWLRREVHGRANLLGFQDLLIAATGRKLDPAAFEAHLARRYLA